MEIKIIYTMLFFVLGTIMGSFYNVVGYRLPKGMSLIKPDSHCPNCNHKLNFMELIPVVSYIIQWGKCKHCRKKIAIFYPIFEFLTGVLFAVSYLIFGLSNELLVALTFVSTILVVIISDLKYLIIPDEVLLFSGVMLIIERLIGKAELFPLVLDVLIPFVFLLLIKLIGDFMFKKESLGGGDIKLMVIFGIVIGWENCILVVVLGSIIALPISLIVLMLKKTNIIPFGPFLSMAALIIYYGIIDYVPVLNWLINR